MATAKGGVMQQSHAVCVVVSQRPVAGDVCANGINTSCAACVVNRRARCSHWGRRDNQHTARFSEIFARRTRFSSKRSPTTRFFVSLSSFLSGGKQKRWHHECEKQRAWAEKKRVLKPPASQKTNTEESRWGARMYTVCVESHVAVRTIAFAPKTGFPATMGVFWLSACSLCSLFMSVAGLPALFKNHSCAHTDSSPLALRR